MRVTMFVCAMLLAACEPWDAPYLAQRASEVRELPLYEVVPVRRLSRESFAAEAEEQARGLDDAWLDDLAATYGRLGLFDPALDLRPILSSSRSDWVGAQYSPSERRITLVGDATMSTVVHEWIHALQDQSFGLADYDSYDTSDAYLARRAVVEGDARLGEIRFARDERIAGPGLTWDELLRSSFDYADGVIAGATVPPYFLRYPSFVYAYGLAYQVSRAIGPAAGGARPLAMPLDWGAVDALYGEARPDTTLEILSLGQAPAPVDFGVTDVPPPLANELAVHDRDVLGAWNSYMLLLGGLEREVALALAAQWRGDRVLWTHGVDTGAIGVVWSSSWSDDGAARAVSDALATLHGGELPGEQGAVHTQAVDGEPLYVARLGREVVMVKNLQAPQAEAMAAAAFAQTSAGPVRRLRPSLAQVWHEATGCTPVSASRRRSARGAAR